MVIITKYKLKRKHDQGLLYVVPLEYIQDTSNKAKKRKKKRKRRKKSKTPRCPYCGGKLVFRDYRKRIRKKEGGVVEHIMVRRLRCPKCKSLHTELPDILVPHKHYEAEVISGVLDGIVTPNDADSEDYPCEETMRRWRRWFNDIHANIDGQLRNVGYNIFGLGDEFLHSTDSLIEAMRGRYQNWLEWAVSIICNIYGCFGVAPDLF